MIAEVEFNGYRFFKNENLISFVPDTRTKKLLSNSVEVDGLKVLKSVGIYGQNNSGKTNLISLFRIIKLVLSGSDDFVCNRAIFNDLNEVDISITFNNLDGLGWLKYSFSYENAEKKYIKESLSEIRYYENGAPYSSDIFIRDIKNKKLEIFGEEKNEMLDLISAKKPLLYLLELESGRYSELKRYLDSLNVLSNKIKIVNIYNIPISNTIGAMKGDDEKKKQFIVSFVKNADLSLSNFYFDTNPKENFEKNGINESALRAFEKHDDTLHLTTQYGEATVPSLFFDSSGTKKIEAVASYIYDSIRDGNLLLVDEIDNGLHYKLTRAIVSAFNNLANNKGQLLFTAHDLLLIDCNYLMRKDQIYFVKRNSDFAELDCLKNYTAADGTREITDFIRRYNHGDFGYSPSPNFIKDIIKLTQDEHYGKE